jgi:quercetin dioxygenase-like cupin family protein
VADRIRNQITGEEIAFRRTGAATGGRELEFDWSVPMGFQGPPHVHPVMHERLEVLRGSMAVRMNGVTYRLEQLEAQEIRPGTPHRSWNEADHETVVRVILTPALKEEQLLRQLFDLANQGRLGERTIVEKLLEEFRQESVPATVD